MAVFPTPVSPMTSMQVGSDKASRSALTLSIRSATILVGARSTNRSCSARRRDVMSAPAQASPGATGGRLLASALDADFGIHVLILVLILIDFDSGPSLRQALGAGGFEGRSGFKGGDRAGPDGRLLRGRRHLRRGVARIPQDGRRFGTQRLARGRPPPRGSLPDGRVRTLARVDTPVRACCFVSSREGIAAQAAASVRLPESR